MVGWEEITFLVSRLLHREWPSLLPINEIILTHSFNIYSDFAYITVLYMQFTIIGSPLINFCIIDFFPIPYTRDVVSHHM